MDRSEPPAILSKDTVYCVPLLGIIKMAIQNYQNGQQIYAPVHATTQVSFQCPIQKGTD